MPRLSYLSLASSAAQQTSSRASALGFRRQYHTSNRIHQTLDQTTHQMKELLYFLTATTSVKRETTMKSLTCASQVSLKARASLLFS